MMILFWVGLAGLGFGDFFGLCLLGLGFWGFFFLALAFGVSFSVKVIR